MAKQIKDRWVELVSSCFIYVTRPLTGWVLLLHQRAPRSRQQSHQANQCSRNSPAAAAEWYHSFHSIRCCALLIPLWMSASLDVTFTRIHPLLYGPILSYSSTCSLYLCSLLSTMQWWQTPLVIFVCALSRCYCYLLHFDPLNRSAHWKWFYFRPSTNAHSH